MVETLSKAFGRLPDPVLLPWLPTLITTLRTHAAELVPVLTREAGRTFPATLAELDTWTPPWNAPATPAGRTTNAAPAASAAGALLAAHPEATDAVASLLGCAGEWMPAEEGAGPVADLLTAHPDTAQAMEVLLAG